MGNCLQPNSNKRTSSPQQNTLPPPPALEGPDDSNDKKDFQKVEEGKQCQDMVNGGENEKKQGDSQTKMDIKKQVIQEVDEKEKLKIKNKAPTKRTMKRGANVEVNKQIKENEQTEKKIDDTKNDEQIQKEILGNPKVLRRFGKTNEQKQKVKSKIGQGHEEHEEENQMPNTNVTTIKGGTQNGGSESSSFHLNNLNQIEIQFVQPNEDPYYYVSTAIIRPEQARIIEQQPNDAEQQSGDSLVSGEMEAETNEENAEDLVKVQSPRLVIIEKQQNLSQQNPEESIFLRGRQKETTIMNQEGMMY